MNRVDRKPTALILSIAAGCLLIASSAGAQWILVDSTSVTDLIPAGERLHVCVEASTEYLQVSFASEALTPAAEAAIGIAPDWLKRDLRDSFRRLSEANQDLYAGLINAAVPPYVDEICFEVAHLAPQTLGSSMDPQVLIDNVESLYEIDAFLGYADIVDYDLGADYYSTIVYRVQEDRDIVEIELPRDIYYWYIVHPKLHKEAPNYINPNTGYPADPPTGVFWRDWLMNEHDTGYPLLRTCLEDCDVLWKSQQNTLDNGAVGAVTGWIQDVMTFQSYSHHDQPVRIYRWHIGTCSVHSYLTAAAARAALIPTAVDAMYSDNHKINEFWERRWIAWEPVNTYIDYPQGYENWGWLVAGTFNWRGDGFIWGTTERYTEVCTLNVTVTDNAGQPVDGARIKIRSNPCVSWGTIAGWTDRNGQHQFTLGDGRTFQGHVGSSIGYYPPSGLETVIVNSQPGASYNWDVTLSGAVPAIGVSDDTLPPEPTNDYRLVVDYDVPTEILYGNNFDDNNSFAEPSGPGQIDFFICDQENFGYYLAEQSFDAFEIAHNSSAGSADFVLVSPDSWYAVFANDANLVLTQEVQLTARLYVRDPSTVAENEAGERLGGLGLCANYPNPFHGETRIAFALPRSGGIELGVYSVSGERVRTLISGHGAAGRHTAVWDGYDDAGNAVGSGVYFWRLCAADDRSAGRMLLIK
jgi:hypothetical protein